jgi:hypothetical protein
MKVLKITDCSDSLMWYRNLIGKYVPYRSEDPDVFWSRETAGYTNIVQKIDAEIVEVPDDTKLY